MKFNGYRPLVLFSFVLFVVFAACIGPKPSTDHDKPVHRIRPRIEIPALEKQIHRLINRERKRQGLAPLAWDDRLAAIARGHSRDMATKDYFSHYSKEGHDFSFRYNQAGYTCSVRSEDKLYLGAENILQNNLYDSVTTVDGKRFYDWNSQEKIAETTVQGWMNSRGHRQNIMTPHWRREGIGVIIAPDDKVYITQNFC